MSHATFSTRRGSWERDDPLFGTTGVAIGVIFQTTSFPEGENRKDSTKRERTTSKTSQLFRIKIRTTLAGVTDSFLAERT